DLPPYPGRRTESIGAAADGAPTPEVLRVGLQRPVDFDSVAVRQPAVERDSHAIHADRHCGEVDFRVASRYSRQRQCLGNAGAGRQRELDLGGAGGQRVDDGDGDPLHAPRPWTAAARLTKASMKLSAMRPNTGPINPSSTAVANS